MTAAEVALRAIAGGTTTTFDEGEGHDVEVWLDAEEMQEIARKALADPIPDLLAERDAEIARLSALTRSDAARGFPANTCPASRHAQMIGKALMSTDPMKVRVEDPKHVGESILATVAALYEARVALATREAENVEQTKRADVAEHMLNVRTRQLKTCGDYWCRAAEKALAGDLSELHNRVELRKMPGGLSIVQSDAALTNSTEGGDT